MRLKTNLITIIFLLIILVTCKQSVLLNVEATSIEEETKSKETKSDETEYEEKINLSITPKAEAKKNEETRVTKLVNYINNYLAKNNISEKNLKKKLKKKVYNSDEIKKALKECNINWNKQALKYLKKHYNNKNLTKTEVTKKMKSKNFTSKQIKYAIKNSKIKYSKRDEVVEYALKFVGNPYVYGGSSLTHGTDCSGFIMSVYKHFGKSLPHSSDSQAKVGKHVPIKKSALKEGDIICYSGHVAMYIGNGKIIHASNRKDGIKISNNWNYRKVVAVRRIF